MPALVLHACARDRIVCIPRLPQEVRDIFKEKNAEAQEAEREREFYRIKEFTGDISLRLKGTTALGPKDEASIADGGVEEFDERKLFLVRA